MVPYRAWINQPSTLQAHHHLHGKRCIVTEEFSGPNSAHEFSRVYFTDGEIISMTIPANATSPCADAGKLVTTGRTY